MPLAHEHDLHRRRLSRNLGLGGVLLALVFLIFGMTFVKVTAQNVQFPETVPGVQKAAPVAATSGN
ncbi:cytochrome C oxidase assembly protein [Pseudooceanicola sediminis]|uniref:Cytochrome C oxidase assembly protein n=1 Tax=Pseudooceanicola sediminis TaxID=2211117 RepID=A0A399J455_9RHOB|nr:cytochrome C oxidase assembly protein [Pseudooceanicola sediminis]KAA2311528.1 cytochrome C oxidase assembly protein [Puniceibacterium sp. HSS470]RII40030.1 cytochrome C oxidase assembly protein [Pseudooceanicola sediminis]|tara:strand:+ start:99562 stop:99759 length:198 start_codon:yes stop_codon:yes gene_type:complete